MRTQNLADILAAFDAANDRVADYSALAHIAHIDRDDAGEALVTACSPYQIVRALRAGGLDRLRQQFTTPTHPTPTRPTQDDNRPSPVDARPVKQPRKTTRQTTTPDGWGSVEA